MNRQAQQSLALVWLLAGITGSSGCYRYVQSTNVPRIGSHVELTLKDDAAADFRGRGINFVEYFTTGAGALDGIVLEHTEDSLLVQIASVRIGSYRGRTLYQRVALAHTDLAQVKHRRHNAAGTLALAAVGGSIITLVLLKAFNGGSDGCAAPLAADCR